MGRHANPPSWAVEKVQSTSVRSWADGVVDSLDTAGLSPEWAAALVSYVLSEDLGGNPGRDLTTNSIVAGSARCVVNVVARADGVLAGAPLIAVVLSETATRFGQPRPAVDLRMADGARVRPGDVVAVVSGSTRTVLTAERTMLNLVGRASGVATATGEWASALAGTDVSVIDSRNTTPGLRALEKYAVRVGGGANNRLGLYDVATVERNHRLAAGSVGVAYGKVRALFPNVPVQVEVSSTEEAVEAVSAGARHLVLTDMSVADMKAAVQAARTGTEEPLEIGASGGLSLTRAREYAWTGVDYLSVAGVTNASAVLELGLEFVQ